MGKYSQNNEDQVILDYFKGKAGTFIDIGANDGKTLSNTRLLVENGWSGVFVEPSPTAFQKLKENYPNQTGLYFYPFALGVTNDEVDMYDSGSHLSPNDHGLLSTLLEDEKLRWKNQHYDKIKVKCFRWKTFLNRLKHKTFDFISIDAEGMDFEILKQINLQETRCVCIEWNSNPQLKEQLVNYMLGYNLIYTSPENLIFARA